MRIFNALAVFCTLSFLACSLLQPATAKADVLMPTASLGERQAALDAFWRDWKRVYLHEGCGGAYVDTSGDGKPTYGGSAASTLTVSEAHGYGMLALVRMARRDPEAHRLFDAMVAFYRQHPTVSGSGLMAWNQTRDCKDAPDGGNMSASDGDLDVALALQLANGTWGEYFAEARKLRAAILAEEVTADGMIRLGDWATEGDYGAASRSSDFMPASFAVFARSGDKDAARWSAMRDRGYAVWGRIATVYAGQTGLVPDFISGLPDNARPAKPSFLEGETDGFFSWNALRFPWRLALDLLETGEPRARDRLQRINRWIATATGGDPAQIASSYRLDGTIPPDEAGNSTAFVAMFAAAAVAGSGASDVKADQMWLDRLWDAMLKVPIEDEDYYGNTLKLMAMMALAEVWTPSDRLKR